MTRILLSIAACIACAPVFASGPGEGHGKGGTAYLGNGVFVYEVFEASVTHSDLASCPVDFDQDVVFCRMTVANDQAHIFVFSLDGEQPLLAVKHYDLDDGFLPF